MSAVRAGATASVVNDKIYVIGGYYNEGSNRKRSNVIEEYDPTTDSWKTLTPMPTARSWATSAVIGDEIYVFGGAENGNTSGTTHRALSVVKSYNTLTDTWTTRQAMPNKSVGLTSANIDGKIYLFGGSDYSQSSGSVNEYDPETDTWQFKLSMQGINSMGTTVVNGKVYILGGAYNVSSSFTNEVKVYDPISNTLSPFKNSTFSRNQTVSASIGNNIYIIGGTNGRNALKTVEMYSILPDPEQPGGPDPEVPEQPSGNRAILVITMNTGLEKEYDLPMSDINEFLNWYDLRDAGSGPAKFAINKYNNNKGPFSKRTDYVIFDKILHFEVNEYSI